MITNLNDFTNFQPDQVLIDQTLEEYLGTFERRMVVFENYWNDSFFNSFNNQSVKPYIENIQNLIGEPVSVVHKTIHSKEDLSYYIGSPGVMWNHPEIHGVNVWSFNFHGTSDGITLPSGLITKDYILQLCEGKFSDFPNILYFSSCNLFEDDDDFGNDLLKTSGSRGVLGFKKKVGFSIGTIVDLLFLICFFKYKDGDPFENLQNIYEMVITELPVSKEYGFTLYC